MESDNVVETTNNPWGCSCGGGAYHGHTADCQLGHFLSYSSLIWDADLHRAFMAGIEVGEVGNKNLPQVKQC